jgi:hypothetical protein
MPFTKGNKLGGRKKGAENKSTIEIKEAYAMLITHNIPNLVKWLDAIAKKDPAKAIYILSDLSEYVIPKLARTDLTNDGEKFEFGLNDEQLIKRASDILNRTGKV